MLSINPLRNPRRISKLALVIALAAGSVGCNNLAGDGGSVGSGETISAGAGQAVIPKQELENLGATEKSLAPPSKKTK